MGINEDILEVVGTTNELYSGLYQDYLQPPLDQLPAHVRTTRQKLNMLLHVLPVSGQRILDVGCANGALDIELALKGADVQGVDFDNKSIKIANMASQYFGLHIPFRVAEAESIREGSYDVILFLAVWKHIRWKKDMEIANNTLKQLSYLTDTLIFDPGLSDAGTDLGSPIKKSQVPRLICDCTNYPHIEMISNFIDTMNIEREVWMCWR